MIRRNLRLVALVAFGGLLLLAVSPTIHADNAPVPSSGITVTPALLQFSLSKDAPDQTIRVQLTNNYDSAVQLTARFQGINEQNGVFVPSNQNVDSHFASALNVSETNLILAPHEVHILNVTMRNLANLAPGGHYATLVLGQQGAGHHLSLQAAISLAVFGVKTAGEQQSVGVTGVRTNGWLFHQPSSVTLTFKNTGNVAVVPRAQIVTQPFGTLDPIAKGIANQNSLILLPDQQTDIVTPLSRLRRVFWPTHPQLLIAYRYDGATQPTLLSQRYWYIPPIWPVIIIAGGYLLYRRRRGSKSAQVVKPAVIHPGQLLQTVRKRIAVADAGTTETVDVDVASKLTASDVPPIKSPTARKKSPAKPATTRKKSAKSGVKKPAAKRTTTPRKSTKKPT